MLTSRRLGNAAALLALLFAVGCGGDGVNGKDGAKGDPGAAGETGPAGDPGNDGTDGKDGVVPPLTNDVTGTVTDGTNPLQGVAVTVEGSTKTASTDAQGKFTLSALDVGAYQVTLHKDGYLDQTLEVAVNLSGPTTVTAALAVDKTKLTPPAVSVTDNLLAGFGASVSLKATATGTAPFTYKWTQAEGPDVSETLSGATTDTLGFTTQSFAEAMGDITVENARFGALGVNPDQAGNYVFEVEVTDANGLVTKSQVKVNATRPSSGLRMVPVGVPVYFQGDGTWPSAPVPASPAPSCTTDADCGSATSGLICTGTTTKTCAAGCKGTGGNACPTAFTCSSTTAAAGTCNKQVGWDWHLDLAPTGSTAALANASSQFPSFVPDEPGSYKIREAFGKKTMTVYAGSWTGEMTADGTTAADCNVCHQPNGLAPDNFKPWRETRHAKGMADILDGKSTQFFVEECYSCHTVGFDKAAANNGFDDVQPNSGWSYPTKLQSGNYATLVGTANLGKLVNVQCESCHGPDNATATPHKTSTNAKGCNADIECTSGLTGGQGYCDLTKPSTGFNGKCVADLGARVSLSADVCSRCHQEKPFLYKGKQWAESGHANLELAIGEGSVEQNVNNLAHCGRCHSAQGFIRYVGQLGQNYYAHLTSDGKALDPAGVTNHRATGPELARIGMNKAEVQPQTCAACHDPHDATNHAQLRVYDKISALPNGMTNLSGMGSGAVCTACHNSRNAEHSDFVQATTDTNGNFVPMPYLTSFSGPHSSAQGDFVYGFNAYFNARYNPSAHLAVKDTCAGCHYGIATNAQQMSGEDKNHSFKVDNTICASCHADGVNGDALQAANGLSLENLRSLIAQKTKSSIANAMAYVPASGTMGVYARAYDKATNSYSSSASAWTPTATGWINLVGNVLQSVNLAYASNGTTMMLELTLQNAVTFTPTGATTAITSNKILVAFTGLATNQIVVNGDNAAWPKTGSTTAYYSVFSAPGPKSGSWTTTYPAMPDPPAWVNANHVQVLYKAYWNMSLLASDNTLGIHNPKFFNDVVAKTSAQLNALPN